MKHFALILALVIAVPAAAAIVSVRNDLSTRSNYSDGVLIGAQSAVFRGVLAETSEANSDTIDFRFHRKIAIARVSGGTTSVTLYVEAEPSGTTWRQAKDDTGAVIGPITIDGTSWIDLPDEIFTWGAVRLVGDVSGTFDVCLKG